MKKSIVACFALLLMVFSAGCGNQDTQQLSFVIPHNLMGGNSAEDSVASYNSGEETVPTDEGDIPISEYIADMTDNGDNTLTYTFSSKEQLEKYKKVVYAGGELSNLDSLGETTILSAEYQDDVPSKITVYVSHMIPFLSSTTDQIFASVFPATYMGIYQVLSGTDPDEWHATVYIVDQSTGDQILEYNFPEDFNETTTTNASSSFSASSANK